jgi:hypothetical protein
MLRSRRNRDESDPGTTKLELALDRAVNFDI